MSSYQQRPTEVNEYEAKKFIINKHDLHNTRSLMDVIHPDPDVGYLASIYWVGKSPGLFQDVCQPAIFCPNGIDDRYLSYDGKANFVLSGNKNDYDFLHYPFDGIVYKMTPDELHYFKKEDPLIPNYQYELKTNNNSITMHDVSIFDKTYNHGCMVTIRASFEGKTVDDNLDGNAIILITVQPVI